MASHVLETLVAAGVLAIVAAVAGHLLRLRPAVRFAMWLVVLVRLLMPPVVRWPWGVAALAPERLVETLPQAALAAFGAHGTAPAPFPGGPGAAGPGVGSAWTFIVSAVAAIWVAGSIVALLRQSRTIIRYNRVLTDSAQAPPFVTRIADQVARRLEVATPAVVVVTDIRTPFVWSWGHPRIAIPAWLLDDRDPVMWRSVLAHELAHVRRRDHWYLWLELAGSVIWWWNPLFRIARDRLRRYAEQAADSWAVSIAPGERRAYAEALLRVAERGGGLDRSTPVLAASSGSRRRFADRLTLIFGGCGTPRLPRPSAFAISTLALLSAPSWLGAGGTVPPTDEVVADRQVPSAEDIDADASFQLHPAYPNPFDRATTIPFTIDQAAFDDGVATVSLLVYDLLAQPVGAATMSRGPATEPVALDGVALAEPGRYEACWEGRDGAGRSVARGVYIVRLVVDDGPAQVIRVVRTLEDAGGVGGGCPAER